MENFEVYISNEGYLIIPKYNIKYLINFNESDIPSMAEAVESTVRVAGRDGDISLKTTYEPIPFNIVCYTDDNLEIGEKEIEEENITRFLNSIKNKTIKLAFEKYKKYYEVKYSGALSRINYPKFLQFSIPLKSSDSYAKDIETKSIIGNGTENSKTIENVGAIFIIKGPAQNPIISLNDYSMEYNMSILDGSKVEINSKNSTITNINSDGVRTNVMKYYNHQFPKIEFGNNQLKILSGIENPENVSVSWNDLKL